MVSNILRKCANILLVNDEHRKQFAGKVFVSFRRAKNLKDTLVRAKLQAQDQELVPKELLNAVERDVKSALLFKRAAVSLMRMIRDLSRIFQGLTIAILQT